MSWHPHWLTMMAMLSVAAAETPAGAQRFNVINPLGVRRDDSLVSIPVDKSRDWSIRVGGKVLPAQYDASTGSVHFVMSMGAHETARVELIPAVAPPSPARVLVTLKVPA
ncbi:MAG: hypothetical protein JF571_01900 [Asticcacaulis sp.]|nr:hypothetical protein [Asticcacaulis sp.]